MRIYLAGKYSADNIIGVLDNIHNGIKVATKIIKKGHAVFCPWLDYQYHFFDNTLTKGDYQRNSMAWVDACDELWVMPGSEASQGTQREIIRATEMGKRIRYLQSMEVI